MLNYVIGDASNVKNLYLYSQIVLWHIYRKMSML